ncbi:MAG: hypothetical protein ACOX8M_13565 [Marvinbryantia sp.]|jgi:hypothetical protein
MGKCIVCGKKGLFFKVNDSGRCANCEAIYQENERRRLEYAAEEKKVIQSKSQNENEYPRYEEAYFLDVVDDHILSYQYKQIKIAFPCREKVELGNFIDFEQEPDNDYDSNAVKILCSADTVGYICKGRLQDMINDFLMNDLPIEARVDSVSKDSFTIAIAFYKSIDSFKSVSATLTKTNKKDCFDNSRQDNLSSVSEGDMLTMEYDYETETYIVSDDCGNELGEISKSISDKLFVQSTDYDYKVICKENDVDDNLKYKCAISVLFFKK